MCRAAHTRVLSDPALGVVGQVLQRRPCLLGRYGIASLAELRLELLVGEALLPAREAGGLQPVLQGPGGVGLGGWRRPVRAAVRPAGCPSAGGSCGTAPAGGG